MHLRRSRYVIWLSYKVARGGNEEHVRKVDAVSCKLRKACVMTCGAREVHKVALRK